MVESDWRRTAPRIASGSPSVQGRGRSWSLPQVIAINRPPLSHTRSTDNRLYALVLKCCICTGMDMISELITGWPQKATYRIMKSVAAPNAYTVDGMLGRTVRSGKPQAPIYSLVFKNTMFDFCYDWAKVLGL